VLQDISHLEGHLNRDQFLKQILGGFCDISESHKDEIKAALCDVLERLDAELSEKQSRFLRRGMKVTSLSERARSVVMWSHYADQHAGFCVEYDFSPIPPSHFIRRSCFPVFYRNKMTDFTRFVEKGPKKSLNPFHGIFASIIKHKEWSYEKEWRIVFPSGTDEPFPIEMPLPKSVTVGTFASDENVKRMVEFGDERGVPIYQLKQRRDAYRLEPLPKNDLAKNQPPIE
jgi:hypothetical protein